jgi:aspartate/methionine/tyrosine aminotransferase
MQPPEEPMPVSRLLHVPPIGVDRLGDAADAAADPEILRLENMDTDIPPPPHAVSATRAAIGRDDCNSYLPFMGQDALRQAAAAHVSKMSTIPYDWKRQCLISTGGCSGILNTFLALLEPGDEVIFTDPVYVGLLNRARLAGGVPRFAPLVPDATGWRLDLDGLKKAVSGRTRMVLMISPSMPSGAVLNRQEWETVAEICRATNAWLLYDAAMERLLFDGLPYIHPASLPGMAERTITVGAVTKEFRMIGWRVGWIVGPEAAMNDIALVNISNVVCQVGIAMPGATAALTQPGDGIAEATAELEARRDLVLAEMRGLPLIPPGGGWSLLIDVSQLGMDGETASRLLFARGKIAATPMRNWGSERAANFLRFVFANEPVARLRGLGERVRRAWNL